MSQVIIDVREKDEFAIECVENSINIPLSSFNHTAPGILNQLQDRNISFMCRSGARATQAKNIASGMGFNDAHAFDVYKGGIIEWKKQGGETVSLATNKTTLPLIRQVQIVIGTFTVLFGLMGALVDSAFAYAAAAMGAGLLIAGLTGFCALATMMAQLPWNKSKTAKPAAGSVIQSNA